MHSCAGANKPEWAQARQARSLWASGRRGCSQPCSLGRPHPYKPHHAGGSTPACERGTRGGTSAEVRSRTARWAVGEARCRQWVARADVSAVHGQRQASGVTRSPAQIRQACKHSHGAAARSKRLPSGVRSAWTCLVDGAVGLQDGRRAQELSQPPRQLSAPDALLSRVLALGEGELPRGRRLLGRLANTTRGHLALPCRLAAWHGAGAQAGGNHRRGGAAARALSGPRVAGRSMSARGALYVSACGGEMLAARASASST